MSTVNSVCPSKVICNRKAKTQSIDFCWNIENISFHKISLGEHLDTIKSPPFLNHDQTHSWRLELVMHPRRQDVALKDYVQLYLYLEKCPTPSVPVEVQFILKQHHPNGTDLSFSFTSDFKVGTSFGYNRFVFRDGLFNPHIGLIPQINIPNFGCINNNQVQIICKIKMLLSFKNTIETNGALVAQNIDSGLGVLLENGRFSDCVLLSDDNKEIKAHKNIIATNSETIARAFESSCEEGSTGRYKMVGFSYEICKQIVDWMYKKSCDKLDEFAEELFEAADQYDIKDLQLAASNSILDSLSTDNALRRYQLAHMHDEDGELKSRIFRFIKINIEEIRESDTWRAAKEADQGLFIELFENFVDGLKETK